MNIKEVEEALREARPGFYQYPYPVKIYWHWTAGHRDMTFNDYHFCIDGSGDIIPTLPLNFIPTATYRRNTGSIAIALCGCYGAQAFKGNPDYCRLGDEPPTDDQIEALAMLSAKIAQVFDIDIDIEHFMTHAEAADNLDGYNAHEPYGPNSTCERWDLAVLHEDDEWMSGGDILRGKAIFYREQMDMLDEE